MKRFLSRAFLIVTTVAGLAASAHAAPTAFASATDVGNGNVRFDALLPSGQAYVELFIRQNDIQNAAVQITRYGTDHGNGTTTYSFTLGNYHAGDRIEYRFYSYLPQSPGVFTPGPIEKKWRLFIYGSNQFVTADRTYILGPFTMGSGGANDQEVFDSYVTSKIVPMSTGWELVRANPSPFSAALLDNAAGMLGVYVKKCDGSAWVNIQNTPFAVQAVSENVDVAAGLYTWTGVFNAELPGTRIDPTYECGGYDIVVNTIIGPQTLRTNTTTEFAYVFANKL
jgi:hypothetical protein